jgi:hypothetical protein
MNQTWVCGQLNDWGGVFGPQEPKSLRPRPWTIRAWIIIISQCVIKCLIGSKLFFFFFDMSAQKVEEGIELVTSALLGVVLAD